MSSCFTAKTKLAHLLQNAFALSHIIYQLRSNLPFHFKIYLLQSKMFLFQVCVHVKLKELCRLNTYLFIINDYILNTQILKTHALNTLCHKTLSFPYKISLKVWIKPPPLCSLYHIEFLFTWLLSSLLEHKSYLLPHHYTNNVQLLQLSYFDPSLPKIYVDSFKLSWLAANED